MRVIPKITRIAISGIFVGGAAVADAIITIILHRVDTESLAEHAVDIEVDCIANAPAAGRIGDTGPEIDCGNVLAGIVGPLHILTGAGKRDKSMSRGLKLRA